MNQNPLREITKEMAGHIRQAMAAHEIAKELENGDYSAELIMQHLLRFVDLMADRLQDPHAVRAMAQRCEIALSNDELCDWEQNEDGWWNTDCNNAFQFTDGSPIFNEFKFCPYCGKTLTETPYDEESDT